MQAARIHQYGGQDVVTIEIVDMPQIAADEVLVKVVASAVNPLDWIFRSGRLQDFIPVEFPITLGWDCTGVIVEAGSEVTGFQPGDAVFSRPEVFRDGSHAEYIAIPAKDVAHKPRTVSFSMAASLPIASITAWQSLMEQGELKAGQTVLIHGGGGSLGCIAVQIAKSAGARVIVTATTKNHAFVRSLGADEVIDYKEHYFPDVISDVDLVLDTIGGQVERDSYKVLKKNGILVAVNVYPDHEEARAHGVQARFLSIRPNGEHLRKVTELVDAGQLRPIVGHEFPFSKIKEAMELSETGKARGKIILHVGTP